MYTAQVFIAEEKPKVSSPFSTPQEAAIWCSQNYRYGDDVWVITDAAGVVVDRGFCDNGFERFESEES